MRWMIALLCVVMWTAPAEKPFSHRQHAALKMKCAQCHATAETEETAGFPTAAQCRTCHVSMAARTIPAKRVYRVRDFVVFSHGRHSMANAACNACHGEVYTQDTLKLARPTTMAACVACHKETRATVECNSCHDLGQ